MTHCTYPEIKDGGGRCIKQTNGAAFTVEVEGQIALKRTGQLTKCSRGNRKAERPIDFGCW